MRIRYMYFGVVRQKVVKDVEQGRVQRDTSLSQLTIFASGLRGSVQRTF